jgi:hypothetical protein
MGQTPFVKLRMIEKIQPTQYPISTTTPESRRAERENRDEREYRMSRDRERNSIRFVHEHALDRGAGLEDEEGRQGRAQQKPEKGAFNFKLKTGFEPSQVSLISKAGELQGEGISPMLPSSSHPRGGARRTQTQLHELSPARSLASIRQQLERAARSLGRSLPCSAARG